MAFADVGEVELFYTDEGGGDPPFLFVHGFTCDSHDWSWQIPAFTAGHRVIAADLRGHGRSGVPAGGFNVPTFAADLAGLLDQLDCGPVIAVGHSLGGVIVSALAVEYPEKVRAVVSVDPGYLVDDAMAPMLAGAVDAMRSGDAVAVTQGVLGALYVPATPANLRTWHLRRVAGVPPHVIIETFAGLFGGGDGLALRSASEPYLRRRTRPVLAFYTDPARAATEQGLLPDPPSKVVVWDGSGHWLHQERPEEFNSVLQSWVAGLEESG
jgi:pimeloyl-ACP methyl ester carboxylesterase